MSEAVSPLQSSTRRKNILGVFRRPKLGSSLRAALKKPSVRGGVQSFAGMLLLLIVLSIPHVWTSLSISYASITPVYAVVSFSIVLQPNVGTALNFVVQRVMGAAVGGAFGIVAMYLTYAANAASYASSVAKGAMMTASMFIGGFLLALGAFRFNSLWFGFIVAGLSVPVVALSGYHLDFLEVKTMPYFLLQVVLGVVAAAITSMFVLPITAGRTIHATTCTSLEMLGTATRQLMTLLLPARDPDEARSSEPQFVAPEAIQAFIDEWAHPVSGALVKATALLHPVSTEIDVFHRPHVFPRHVYAALLALLRDFLSTMMTLVYLTEGNAPLSAARTLSFQITPIGDSMAACMTAAAAVLRQEPEASYAAALGDLSKLESLLHSLYTVRVPAVDPATGREFSEGEVLVADTLVAVAFSLGTRVRRLFFVLSEVVGPIDPEVWPAWRLHFKGERWDFAAGSGGGTPISIAAESPLALQQVVTEARSPMTQHHIARLSETPLGSPATARMKRAAAAVVGSPQARGRSPGRSPMQAHPISVSLERTERKIGEKAAPPADLVKTESAAATAPLPTSKSFAFDVDSDEDLEDGRRPGDASKRSYPSAADLVMDGEQLAQTNTAELRLQPAHAGCTLKPSPSFPSLVMAFPTTESTVNGKGNGEKGAAGSGTPPAITGDASDRSSQPAPSWRAPRPSAGRWAFSTFNLGTHLYGGFTGEHLLLSFQLALAIAAATALHVCNASYEALGRSTVWAVISVVVMAQRSVGGALLRGCNRIMGTVAAGLSGIGLLYLVYLLNGLSYANDASKFIFMALGLSGVEGLLMYWGMKSPHQWIYTWTVWKFTLPIVALAGYVSETIQPRIALWRLANIAIGLAIDLVATQIFPVTTRSAVVRRTCDVLNSLADIASSTGHQLLAMPESRNPFSFSRRASTHSAQSTSPVRTSRSGGGGGSRTPPSQLQRLGSIYSTTSDNTAVTTLPANCATTSPTAAGLKPPLPAGHVPLHSPTSPAAVSSSFETNPAVIPTPFAGFRGSGLVTEAAGVALATDQGLSLAPWSSNEVVEGNGASPHSGGEVRVGSSPAFAAIELPPIRTSLRRFSGAERSVSLPAPPSSASASTPIAIGMGFTPRPSGNSFSITTTPAAAAGPNPFPLSPTSEAFYLASPHGRAGRRDRASWLKRVVFGHSMFKLRPLGQESAAKLQSLSDLEVVADFERRALRGWTGVPRAAAIQNARRALRRLLNTLLSFSHVLDGTDVPHLRLLLPHRPDIDAAMEQVGECLAAVGGFAAGELSLERVEATQVNLRAQVQELLLEVERAPPPVGCTQADLVLGFAALGVFVAVVQALGTVSDAVVELCGPEENAVAVEAGDAGADGIEGPGMRKSSSGLHWMPSANVLLSGPPGVLRRSATFGLLVDDGEEAQHGFLGYGD